MTILHSTHIEKETIERRLYEEALLLRATLRLQFLGGGGRRSGASRTTGRSRCRLGRR